MAARRRRPTTGDRSCPFRRMRRRRRSSIGAGRPASAWQYKDPTGRLLGYTARFKKADGGKEVLPYTYCQAADGQREWRWQSFSTPRPLYNLDKLTERPLDWVLVVEGEKTADAAAELFPDHV